MRYLFAAWLLCVAGCMPSIAAVDQELLALVPPGAAIIASIDVAQAKHSRFGQYVLNRASSDDHSLQELIQQTGFDPRRDLQDLVFAVPASASETDGSESKVALIMRGNFDQVRIRNLAKTKGASIQNYQGVDVFVDKSDHDSTAYAFTAPGVLVMGNLATVQQILTNRSHPMPVDTALQQLVANVSANNDAWFASVEPGVRMANHLKEANGQPAAEQAMNSILQSSGGIQFGEVVRFSFDASARSPKDAQSLADTIRFLSSLAQANRQKGANVQILATAMDEMNLQTDGNTVHLSVSLPETSLEQLTNGASGRSIHSRTPAEQR